MSIKIWTAYRLKDPTTLFDVVHDIRITALANARNELRKFYQCLMSNVDEMSPEYLSLVKSHSPETTKLQIAHDLIRNGYKKSITRWERDTYDFNAWVSIRFYKGIYSLVPASDMLFKHIFDFMKHDSCLADWHYQNQVDRDPSVSDQEWEERKAYYEGIDDEDRWNDSLTLIVCDWSNFGDVDPYMDLATEIYRKNFVAKIKDK